MIYGPLDVYKGERAVGDSETRVVRSKTKNADFKNMLHRLTTDAVESEDTALDAYKESFYQKLEEMGTSCVLSDTDIYVNISDEAFERMRSDPTYEARMLESVRRDLNDGWQPFMTAPESVAITIGKNESDYAAATSGVKSDRAQEETENNYWKWRKLRRKQLKEEAELAALKRLKHKRLLNEYTEKKIQNIKQAEWENMIKGTNKAPATVMVSAAEILAGL